tara:strand:- start:1428 stop:1865 length:438 start_codon:yes stop_codon:yes gene_type:complete
MSWEPFAAVIGAYVVIGVFVMITFTMAYKLMGPDGAFRPGTYEVTLSWNLVSLVLGLPAAVLGGWVCVQIDDAPWTGRSLMILIVVLGLLDVAATVKKARTESPARGEDVDNRTAMSHARKPIWVAVANIGVGVVGVAAVVYGQA